MTQNQHDEKTWSPKAMLAFQIVQKAMVSDPPRMIEFTYTDAKNNVTTRTAEPYEIKGDRIFAHCLERDAIRQFSFEQMDRVKIGEPFSPRHDLVTPL